MSLYSLLRPAVFRLDAETAHGLTLKALNLPFAPACVAAADRSLRVDLFGLSFANPLGMAAGFDKNGEAIEGTLRLGFGFAEVGTVTPRPQPGNPRPRIFRLEADRGVINRLGFNNEGHAALRPRLAARRGKGGIVGVNIGANKDATDRIADYEAGISAFADLASYFTVNVSSPNTPGLRDLQARAALDDLLQRVLARRDAATETAGRRVPVLLKISPDMDEAGYADVAEVALARGIDGLIVSNTTLDRTGLTSAGASESGGLSGRPLFDRATRTLARMRRLVGPALPIIGVGGIDGPEAALAKIAAGANLIQVYSGLVYEGPGLVGRILSGLAAEVKAKGLASIAEMVGTENERWT